MSSVWYLMPANDRLLKVATVNGLRNAYTDVYAKNATNASTREVLTCFLLYACVTGINKVMDELMFYIHAFRHFNFA